MQDLAKSSCFDEKIVESAKSLTIQPLKRKIDYRATQRQVGIVLTHLDLIRESLKRAITKKTLDAYDKCSQAQDTEVRVAEQGLRLAMARYDATKSEIDQAVRVAAIAERKHTRKMNSSRTTFHDNLRMALFGEAIPAWINERASRSLDMQTEINERTTQYTADAEFIRQKWQREHDTQTKHFRRLACIFDVRLEVLETQLEVLFDALGASAE